MNYSLSQPLASSQKCHPMAGKCSAKYQPTTWNYDFLQSLKVDHMEMYKDRQNELEEVVKNMVDNDVVKPTALLELVDNIQRLGLGYRFENNLMKALDKIILTEGFIEKDEMSLHSTALCFSLMRQHGHDVSQDVFKRFKNNNGNFKSSVCSEVNGLLRLYEASYFTFEGEEVLAEAEKFTSKYLKDHMENTSPGLAKQVRRALELPLHRRMLRIEAREYIEEYSEMEDANNALLELAVLDFNLVQLTLKRELQEMSRWWRETGLANNLSFARDRITESFFCSDGLVPNPQFNKCRKGLTKIIQLVIVVDDIYDEYGSLEELEMFTQAVERWNLEDAKALPNSMALSFKTLYNTVNEMACDNFQEQGISTISNFRKAWTDLCKAFLLEAKWDQSKYQPTFKDYLENAWLSSTGVVLLVHAYCLISQTITKEALDWLDNHHPILQHPSMVLRLCNDLSSSSADMKGENVAKSIPCYIKDYGVSVQSAHEHIRNLIDVTWEKMNMERATNTIFPKTFIDICFDFARTSHCVYQYGDAYGAPDTSSRQQVVKLLMDPIRLSLRETISS